MTNTELRRIARNLSAASVVAEDAADVANTNIMAAIKAGQENIDHLIAAVNAAERALDLAIEAEEHAWQAVSESEQY